MHDGKDYGSGSIALAKNYRVLPLRFGGQEPEVKNGIFGQWFASDFKEILTEALSVSSNDKEAQRIPDVVTSSYDCMGESVRHDSSGSRLYKKAVCYLDRHVYGIVSDTNSVLIR
jgi:hypothetical protein